MRVITIVLALAACAEVRQTHRWPGHRQEKDAEIARLGEQTKVLASHAALLEARVKQLEQALAKLQQPPPAALPSPGT
jgi:hypothetical protein